MDRIGLYGSLSRVGVVIIGDDLQSVIVDESLGLRLQKILRHNVDAHMQDRQTVDVPSSISVPVSNVGHRPTDGGLADASGRVEELEENDVTREVTQAQRRARVEHLAGRTGPQAPRVNRKVR